MVKVMNASTQQRRRILKIVYDARRRGQPGAVERREFVSALGISPTDVQFHLDYLINKNLIQALPQSSNRQEYTFYVITVQGIDLVEDPSEFNNKFPSQVIVQNVLGDKLDITIGDNSTNVSVGKNITQILDIGSNTKTLDDVCALFIQDLTNTLAKDPERMASIIDLIHSLQGKLTETEIDLGEIQRIKRLMAEKEGRPATWTALIFSHKAVTNPIQEAVKRLIGYSDGSISDG